jgi:tetratricopeptide (TPR) repeat protein
MSYTRLPFFLGWLAFSIATSFSRMWLDFLGKLIPLFVAIIFITFMLGSFHRFGQTEVYAQKLHYLKQQTFENYAAYMEKLAQKDFDTTKKTVQAQADSLTPQQHAVLSNTLENKSPLAREIEYWEAVAQLQPTHRDVLLNLAELYQADKNLLRANEYFDKAKAIDPNYNFEK